MDIEWKAPPPAKAFGRRGNPENIKLAEKLKARPGEWACVTDQRLHFSSAINAGSSAVWAPKGSFEAVSRSNGKKDDKGRPLTDVYVRYVGD